MNISDLTPQKLKRATLIKEKLDDLNKELRRLLDGITTDGAISEKKRTMTAVVKRKIAAAQRASWAKLRRSHT